MTRSVLLGQCQHPLITVMCVRVQRCRDACRMRHCIQRGQPNMLVFISKKTSPISLSIMI